MNASNRPQLWVIAGPNGAGKTTLASRWVANRIPIINPDEIATRLPRVNGKLDERAAGIEALKERAKLLASKRTFAVETTLTGHNPLKLMREAAAAGYKVNLVFVGVDDAALCMSRVSDRVSAGGHNVPPEAIVRRFDDALKKLPLAFEIADRSFILDNAGPRRRIILIQEGKQSRFVARDTPHWVQEALPDILIQQALFARNARDQDR